MAQWEPPLKATSDASSEVLILRVAPCDFVERSIGW
jgi:hypothetical protein